MTDTLPGLLAARAARAPRGIALRQKRLGIWHETTWSQYLTAVRATAAGLAALGLQQGDVVALIGEHRAQWLIAELGVQAAGAIVAPLYADATAAELIEPLRLCAPRFAVVEGQEQVDKLLQLRDKLPSLERVLYWDPRGMRAYHDSRLRPLAEVTGQESGPAPLTPFPVAAIIFSPGAGGALRGARLTHANLIAAARAMVEAEGLDERSEFVSFAPNGWIGDRAFATAAALVAGYPVNLPEEPDTVPQDIQEIGPRLVVAPPLLWQRLEAAARTRAEGAGRLRRRLFRGAVGEGGTRLPGPLAEWLVRRPVRDHLGLLRARRAYNTGAPLPEQTLRFFRAIGVPLRQLYTVTAAGGPVAVGAENAGRALPGAELELAPDGEVLLRGPGVAGAYQGEAAPVTDTGGRLHTGDLGRMEPDGSLTLLDRIDNVAQLADGTRVMPATIERRLTASPYVRHAVALAAGRPYVGALLAIDGPAVNAWAERRGMSVTTYQELSQHSDVRELVRAAVQEANAGLPEPLRVHRFAILDRELSADEGELTRLRTVRRAAVIARWSALVDTLYGTTAAPEDGPRVVAVREAAAV